MQTVIKKILSTYIIDEQHYRIKTQASIQSIAINNFELILPKNLDDQIAYLFDFIELLKVDDSLINERDFRIIKEQNIFTVIVEEVCYEYELLDGRTFTDGRFILSTDDTLYFVLELSFKKYARDNPLI